MASRRDCIFAARAWFLAEWPAWYGAGGAGDVDRDLLEFSASENDLPVGLLVFEGDEVVGFAALKAHSIPSHTHLGPWAAAGFVLPSHRRRGIGAFLLQGLVAKAAHLGFSEVFCGTSTANSMLERSGWILLETIVHDGRSLGVYRIAVQGIDQADAGQLSTASMHRHL